MMRIFFVVYSFCRKVFASFLFKSSLVCTDAMRPVLGPISKCVVVVDSCIRLILEFMVKRDGGDGTVIYLCSGW